MASGKEEQWKSSRCTYDESRCKVITELHMWQIGRRATFAASVVPDDNATIGLGAIASSREPDYASRLYMLLYVICYMNIHHTRYFYSSSVFHLSVFSFAGTFKKWTIELIAADGEKCQHLNPLENCKVKLRSKRFAHN